MFGREKEKEEPVSVLPPETLKRFRQWRHVEVFPCENPVNILCDVFSIYGRPAYEEAARELLLAMRQRFGTKPGYSILVGIYDDPRLGMMLSLAPSPRPGEDCIQSHGGELHPTKGSDPKADWPEDVGFSPSVALQAAKETQNGN
jgi:hypothetical protein